MKTRLYALLAGLLMATCLSSFGQEIISKFTISRTDKDFWECDLFENEDGSYDINLNGSYYGEIIYKMRYRKIRCTPFKWLYVDFETFSSIAKEHGFSCDLLMKNDNYNYLAKMYLANNP